MLKGLIDRAFVPGRTFDTRVPKGTLPRPMLLGRTARVILTSDTPGWFMRFMYNNALLYQLRRQILGFVGIKPTKISHFSGASDPKPEKVNQWIRNVENLATRGA